MLETLVYGIDPTPLAGSRAGGGLSGRFPVPIRAGSAAGTPANALSVRPGEHNRVGLLFEVKQMLMICRTLVTRILTLPTESGCGRTGFADPRRGMHFVLAVAALSVATLAVRADDPPSAADDGRWFEAHIRPVLAEECLKCHGPAKQEGNLRLDSLSAMLTGGDSGPAIVKGHPDDSLLIEAIKYESLEMPPDGQLAAGQIDHFRAWIAKGTPWPEHAATIRATGRRLTSEERSWWAFQPIGSPSVPQLPSDHWSRNPIDRFVLHRLSERGLVPAPQAEPEVLVRRLYFDLIGLPPTPDQIDEFLNDPSPHRWEQLIDRLLMDPRYGEHWGRYWLDLVRYAESDGWNQDAYRPNIWRYRDYVVRAFNEDRPYPQFVLQQLAGDEMPEDDPENLAATGFLRLGIYEYNQRDARSHWNDIMNEMTDVTGDVFLGLGMACARCHDHKFDPVFQTDYFRLRAFFEPIIWQDDVEYATAQQRAAYEKKHEVWLQATAEVRKKIDALLKPYYDRKWKTTVDKFPLDIQTCFRKPVAQRDSWEHQMAYLVKRQFSEEGGGPLKSMSQEDKQKYETLKKELAKLDDLKPPPFPRLMTVKDFPGPIAPTTIPKDPEHRALEPGVPVVLTPSSAQPPATSPSASSLGPRTRLARWIGSPDNPLTTRVIVNRIWQHHFGQGIVASANDFGRLGRPPVHPELLDWLTRRFINQGWSFKKLHKTILMSATWQQSAHHPQAAQFQQEDPGEELLWRARVRRLGAEQIRDAMLAATGELKCELGGPSAAGDSLRRAIYLKSLRNKPHEFLHAFDAADGLKSVAERDSTTTPLQSLLMMNGKFALERADRLADRLKKLDFGTTEHMLRYLFRLMWGRPPTKTEFERTVAFLGSSAADPVTAVDADKLVDLCHVLFNSSEFVYVE